MYYPKISDCCKTPKYKQIQQAIINDVEKGVDKITGESNGQPTSGATKAP